jgi:hypothetical protein
MTIELIVDDRVNISHVIRVKNNRRVNKILFHLLKVPFEDIDGLLIDLDCRSDHDRRIF